MFKNEILFMREQGIVKRYESLEPFNFMLGRIKNRYVLVFKGGNDRKQFLVAKVLLLFSAWAGMDNFGEELAFIQYTDHMSYPKTLREKRKNVRIREWFV